MKKIISFLITVGIFLVSSAQDIVRANDPWYMCHEYDSLIWQRCPSNIGGVLGLPFYGDVIQQYIRPEEGVTVYGLAYTAPSFPLGDHMEHLSPAMMLHRQKAPGNLPTLELIDSLTARQYYRTSRFEYDITRNAAINYGEYDNYIVPSFEFFFNPPIPSDSLTDTFYVSIIFNVDPHEYIISGDSAMFPYGAVAYGSPSSKWWVITHGVMVVADGAISCMNLHGMPSSAIQWGMLFPIVGLRCVAPSLRLVERGNGMATVSWTQAEAGVGYELSFGPYGIEPDSGTIVGTTDTSYTLTGLEGGVREAVWVRKACRYDVYDSTVWSEWSLPLVFLTLGVDEVEGEAVRLQVRDGAVAVVGAADGEEVKLYDALGRQVAAARAAAGTEILLAAPAAGVYTVRIGSQPARRVVLTR